jgi:hypothetical protein
MSAVPWTQVHHTAERVAIIASGPSLRGVELRVPRGVRMIAVNSAVCHLAFAPHFWFTLDPSPANRAIMACASRLPQIAFYAAVPPQYGSPAARRSMRAPPEEGVNFLGRLEGLGGHYPPPGLSTDPRFIHTGNSAYGALGLAFLMGAKRIALLGVDGTSSGYAWGPGSPKDLRHLPALFASAAPQLLEAGVEVIVGSPRSAVDCWPRVRPEDALDWIEEETLTTANGAAANSATMRR